LLPVVLSIGVSTPQISPLSFRVQTPLESSCPPPELTASQFRIASPRLSPLDADPPSSHFASSRDGVPPPFFSMDIWRHKRCGTALPSCSVNDVHEPCFHRFPPAFLFPPPLPSLFFLLPVLRSFERKSPSTFFYQSRIILPPCVLSSRTRSPTLLFSQSLWDTFLSLKFRATCRSLWVTFFNALMARPLPPLQISVLAPSFRASLMPLIPRRCITALSP